MKNKTFHFRRLTAIICFLTSICSANAWSTTITFEAINTSGNMWNYNYTVINDSLGVPIEEFTVFFDHSLYQNLSLGSAPPDWDSIVIQPDAQLPDDGFYDSLALVGGIGVGGTLSGFLVHFEYLGQGSPGPQPFDIVDPVTFQTLDSGMTVASVPVPAALWLLVSGMIPLVAIAIRRPRKKLPHV